MTEFNPTAVLQGLEDAYGQNKLSEALTRHWAQYVPSVFTAKLDADPGREERKAEKFLFHPMESFMCHGDPTEVFRSLKQMDNPPELCGKVFKVGEPTYSCRDCGVDPTCVLCIDCFQRSAHKQHRYKMSTSGGGGYCDCGDVEAWKSEPCCELHKRNTETHQKQNPIEMLSDDIRDRATQIFYATVNYVAQMLLWQKCEAPPDELFPVGELKNIHVTMLFNDEVHTYEQVISCLEKSINCTHKEAVDHATTVDREGRSPIFYGKDEKCEVSKNIIERQTTRGGNKPLKVLVMHSTVVSHQSFAQKILTWLQQIISKSDGLRQLFCTLSLQNWPGEEQSIVEKMMLADTQLWKASRIQSHQLFMSGILMDQESKKQFSILFTRNYNKVMSDFIKDDHFRSVSVTSATVQLFTVPTLAKMLITEHDLLHVILRVFLDQCQSKINDKGKLAFERQGQAQTQSFRRAHYMLYDLKYALTNRPQPGEWTPTLRTNFLHGVQDLLELLKHIQGMDAVVRQTDTHIEFEPEWEGAFNLQLKLQDIICMTLDWAGSDLEVLKETFRLTLAAVSDCWNSEDGVTNVTLEDHTAQCVDYTVSTRPVSIHLPVTRLLAGLFPKLNLMGIPLQEICSESELSPVALIEPAMRSLVLVSQTNAGMWRRNGYSLLNQIYFYHNVRCRCEMYDRDLLMLQVGAALIEPNEFIILILHKFGLMKWVNPPTAVLEDDKERDGDSHRQINMLADEFLQNLIVLLSERHSVGVGNVRPRDGIKKEIIHQLCIQPMAHSELVKALPDDPYHEISIDDVVQEVANFNKPKGVSGKGMYELKPEYYEQYNTFYYHYTKSEQAKSEEAQRKRKTKEEEDKESDQKVSCVIPPPEPPSFNQGFQPITHLLDCDMFIFLLRMVLERAQAKYLKWFSDSHLDKVLHLVGLALHEEKAAHTRGDHKFQFIKKALIPKNEVTLLSLIENLIGHKNVSHASQTLLLKWLVRYFAEIREMRDSEYKMDPALFETLSAEELEEKRKKEQAQLASDRRQKVMNRIKRAQRNFIKCNKPMWDQTKTEVGPPEEEESKPTLGEILEQTDHPVAIGPKKTPVFISGAPPRHLCILCQEKDDIMHDGKAMVLAGFVQKSTVLSLQRGTALEDPDLCDPLFTPSSLNAGAYVSSCGHTMHADCWQKFYDNVVSKERRRSLRFRHHLSYDIEKSEFLCPLCECLGNTVIPLVPNLPQLLKTQERTELSLNDWLDGIQKTVKNSIKKKTEDDDPMDELFFLVPCPLSSITKMMAESVAKNFQLLFDYVYDDASAHFSDSITAMLRKFSGDCYVLGLGVQPDESNSRVPVLGWNSCAFTIMTLEQCLKDEGKSLFGALSSRRQDCLSALVRYSAVFSQVMQHDVIRTHCIRLLSVLVNDEPVDKWPRPPLRDIDMFHYLVTLCLTLPTLFAEEGSTSPLTRIPTGGLNDHHALKMVFTAHLVQIMLCMQPSTEEPMETEADPKADQLLQLYVKVKQHEGCDVSRLPSAYELQCYLQKACLRFLRCAALFFYELTEVQPPSGLYIAGQEKEYELLCNYLDLPVDMVSLFEESNNLAQLVTNWCEDRTKPKHRVVYPALVNQLITLPEDYSELINKISTFTCPKSDGDDSRAPTMCLVCGVILCSQSYCCQTELDNHVVGAATAHTQTCGAGTCIFLRVRECQVLLLSGKTKGCFFAPPYLDVYGETDQGLRRGNALHLCKERYNKLQKLWLGHNIPEEIAHVLESNSNLLSIEWHNL